MILTKGDEKMKKRNLLSIGIISLVFSLLQGGFSWAHHDPYWTVKLECKSTDQGLTVSIAKRFDKNDFEMTVRYFDYVSEITKSLGGFVGSSGTEVYHYINDDGYGNESGLLLVGRDGLGEFSYHAASPDWAVLKNINARNLYCRRYDF